MDILELCKNVNKIETIIVKGLKLKLNINIHKVLILKTNIKITQSIKIKHLKWKKHCNSM